MIVAVKQLQIRIEMALAARFLYMVVLYMARIENDRQLGKTVEADIVACTSERHTAQA